MYVCVCVCMRSIDLKPAHFRIFLSNEVHICQY